MLFLPDQEAVAERMQPGPAGHPVGHMILHHTGRAPDAIHPFPMDQKVHLLFIPALPSLALIQTWKQTLCRGRSLGISSKRNLSYSTFGAM